MMGSSEISVIYAMAMAMAINYRYNGVQLMMITAIDYNHRADILVRWF